MPGQRPFPLRRRGPGPLPGVNALSTHDGVGARVRPSELVGAHATWPVVVPLVSAGTAADENRRDRTAAVFRLDHLGHNPKVDWCGRAGAELVSWCRTAVLMQLPAARRRCG
jgi:hypothetical protein